MALHIFEDKGLGKAPFRLIPPPKLNATEMDKEIACRACGRMIRHRFHIKSADGHMFVVGSECVKKAGDAGLLDALKAEIKRRRIESRDNARQSNAEARIAAQRLTNDGLSNEELANQLKAQLNAEASAMLAAAETHSVLSHLAAPGFASAMAMHACAGKPWTTNMLTHVKTIVTKGLGKGARKGSAAYLAAEQDAATMVDDLQAQLTAFEVRAAELKNQVLKLGYSWAN